MLKWFFRYQLIKSIVRAFRGRQEQQRGAQRGRGPQGGPRRR